MFGNDELSNWVKNIFLRGRRTFTLCRSIKLEFARLARERRQNEWECSAVLLKFINSWHIVTWEINYPFWIYLPYVTGCFLYFFRVVRKPTSHCSSFRIAFHCSTFETLALLVAQSNYGSFVVCFCFQRFLFSFSFLFFAVELAVSSEQWVTSEYEKAEASNEVGGRKDNTKC